MLIGQSALVATVVVAEGSARNTIAIMVCNVSVRTTGDEVEEQQVAKLRRLIYIMASRSPGFMPLSAASFRPSKRLTAHKSSPSAQHALQLSSPPRLECDLRPSITASCSRRNSRLQRAPSQTYTSGKLLSLKNTLSTPPLTLSSNTSAAKSGA